MKRHNTELSNYIWELKETNTNYNLKCKILCRTKTIPKNNKTCHLCSLEKYEIEKLKKSFKWTKEKKRQQPCLRNRNMYFKRTKTMTNKKKTKTTETKDKTKLNLYRNCFLESANKTIQFYVISHNMFLVWFLIFFYNITKLFWQERLNVICYIIIYIYTKKLLELLFY